LTHGAAGAVLFSGSAHDNLPMTRLPTFYLAAVFICGISTAAPATRNLSLQSAAGLKLHDVQAEPVTLDGKAGLRLTLAAEIRRRLPDMPPAEQARLELLAVVADSDFSNGVIEAEIAGEPAPGAPEGARGFVGIAFRVQPDLHTYDAFYLRPTNGRADDQLRRNHSTQYISQPEWTWERLRTESPGRYESYVDLEPGKWTRIRIEVQGEHARLYVDGQPQPTLIVNDLKSGAAGHGAIALWSNPGTIAHFRDLRVTTN
jgi:hypothetical protein